MRISRICLLWLGLCATACAQSYVPALPGYHYQFPRDYFDHPEYRTEWWYYTGNLRAADGHRFGFELTFFRLGVSRQAEPSPWFLNNVYMAHLALSDLSGGQYLATERLNRAGPGLAGVDAPSGTVWNGNWQVVISPAAHTLRGESADFSFALTSSPQKPPAINGEDGISQKAAGSGNASHYFSLTRMSTAGTVTLHGKPYTVEGDTWMDHEFFSETMDTDEVGWDWLSLQLGDRSEVMLYRLRHRDGRVDPYSSGTYVDQNGATTHLRLQDIRMTPSGTTWTSPATGAVYPLGWSVEIPALGMSLQITTPLKQQEFVSRFGPSYWEGAIDVTGHHATQAVQGSGYLEMTGYAHRNNASPAVPNGSGFLR